MNIFFKRQLMPLMLCLALVVGCASRDPEHDRSSDEELERFTRGARTAFQSGQLEQATRYHEQALQRAYLLDDPLEIGNAAYNLAVSLMGEGNFVAADQRLKEAEWELMRAGENLADIFIVQGKLALLNQQENRALFYVNQMLHHPQSEPANQHKILGSLIRGEIAADRGEIALARERLQEASALMGSEEDAELRAGISGLEGRIFMLRDKPNVAARSFDRAAALWRASGRFDDMALALERSAKAYSLAGRPDHAAERAFRAARSLFAQGNQNGALRLLEDASAVARSPALRQRIAQLTDQFHAAGASR